MGNHTTKGKHLHHHLYLEFELWTCVIKCSPEVTSQPEVKNVCFYYYFLFIYFLLAPTRALGNVWDRLSKQSLIKNNKKNNLVAFQSSDFELTCTSGIYISYSSELFVGNFYISDCILCIWRVICGWVVCWFLYIHVCDKVDIFLQETRQ